MFVFNTSPDGCHLSGFRLKSAWWWLLYLSIDFAPDRVLHKENFITWFSCSVWSVALITEDLYFISVFLRRLLCIQNGRPFPPSFWFSVYIVHLYRVFHFRPAKSAYDFCIPKIHWFKPSLHKIMVGFFFNLSISLRQCIFWVLIYIQKSSIGGYLTFEEICARSYQFVGDHFWITKNQCYIFIWIGKDNIINEYKI